MSDFEQFVEDMGVTLIPEGSVIFEPDDINRVAIMFPTESDAIVFFELIKSFTNARTAKI